jgi:hypothetical protein
MRNWLNDARSYIEPVKIGEVMRALGIGRVVESKTGRFKPGDLVSWAEQSYLVLGLPSLTPEKRWIEGSRAGVWHPGMAAVLGGPSIRPPTQAVRTVPRNVALAESRTPRGGRDIDHLGLFGVSGTRLVRLVTGYRLMSRDDGLLRTLLLAPRTRR